MARRLVLLTFLLAWLAGSVRLLADQPSVQTRLSAAVAEVGAELQLEVEVSGASGETSPPQIAVDGLEIRYAGPSSSTQIQFINGRVLKDVRTTHVYQVIPQKEGDFTIPALSVAVDGKTFRTQPIGLKVQKGAAGQDGAAQGGQARAFAEIRTKRTDAYVGEALDVEVRLYVDAQVRLEEVSSAPELNSDSFTVQKFPRFEEDSEQRDGRLYRVVVFRTSLTPTKAGKLEIGPCTIPFVAQVQRQRRNRPKSMFGGLLDDDFFDPFGAFAERRRFDAKAAAVTLNVKPLPTAGRPKSFSGAVGQFSFEAEGSPARVKIGDPVTMRMKVTGEGSFDRMDAPVLSDANGWQTYDPSANFEPSNELRTAGVKTFEVPVVPERKHTQMPAFEFSYFDPLAGTYKTLRSKPAPLEVQGEPTMLTTPVPTPSVAQPAPTPPPPGKPGRDGQTLLGLKYEEGPRRDFLPLFRQPAFWLINLGLAAVLAAFGLARRFRPSPQQTRLRQLRAEKRKSWSALQSSQDAEIYSHAVNLVRIDTAMRIGIDPSQVHLDAVRSLHADKPTLISTIEAVFDAEAERVYAGSASKSGKPSSLERERIVKALEPLATS